MMIEQIVEVPSNRQLSIDVPPEVPAGKTILTFTPVPIASKGSTGELSAKLQALRGSLGKNAFGGLDGVAYQRTIREEWDN